MTTENSLDNSVGRFSIRSYSKTSRGHTHRYHQLVLPIQGSIRISVEDYEGLVSLGECVIIKAGKEHNFSANDEARFVVVDTDYLPPTILLSAQVKQVIGAPLLAFVQFIEKQLTHDVNSQVDRLLSTMFFQLLMEQCKAAHIDKRIEKVIAFVTQDLSQVHTIDALAKRAFLSPTQFKKLFKQSVGVSCQQYFAQLRMNKAKALLSYTDTPISLVAEQVGYTNPSAFSRKFSAHFGVSPKFFIK